MTAAYFRKKSIDEMADDLATMVEATSLEEVRLASRKTTKEKS